MSTHGSSEGWQRNVWALSLCVFIAFVGFQFFSPRSWPSARAASSSAASATRDSRPRDRSVQFSP